MWQCKHRFIFSENISLICADGIIVKCNCCMDYMVMLEPNNRSNIRVHQHNTDNPGYIVSVFEQCYSSRQDITYVTSPSLAENFVLHRYIPWGWFAIVMIWQCLEMLWIYIYIVFIWHVETGWHFVDVNFKATYVKVSLQLLIFIKVLSPWVHFTLSQYSSNVSRQFVGFFQQ